MVMEELENVGSCGKIPQFGPLILDEREPDPIEIGPRPCQLCGCTIEDLEELIYLRAADLIAEWERADPRDRWRHTGETAPKPSEEPRRRAEPYRPPESTVQAFWYVTRNHDADYLAAWLAKHPADRPHLFRIWKAKRCST
jgi:hypothetical protein